MELNISEPWFSYIVSGTKTVEGRLNKGKFADLKVGEVLRINGIVLAYVTAINHYPNFADYMTSEGLERCLPEINSIKEGCAIYHQFYKPEDEKIFGVMAIHLKLV